MRMFGIVLLVLTVGSCQNGKTKELKNELERLKSKPLIINLPIEFFSITDTVYYYSSENAKIVTYIDAQCQVCLLELGLWIDFIEDNKEANIDYLFYIHAEDMNNVTEFLEDIEFEYPVILDVQNNFFIDNKLSINKSFQTFLVDSKNKILLVGNPTQSSSIKKLYSRFLMSKISNP